jgi:hypothetical protein
VIEIDGGTSAEFADDGPQNAMPRLPEKAASDTMDVLSAGDMKQIRRLVAAANMVGAAVADTPGVKWPVRLPRTSGGGVAAGHVLAS